MTRALENTLLLSGILAALGLATFAHPVRADINQDVAHAVASNDTQAIQALLASNGGAACQALVGHAGNVLATSTAQAALAMESASGCCGAVSGHDSAQQFAGALKTVMSGLKSLPSSADQGDAGKIMASALGCAGQPGIVAVEPDLYALALADAAQLAELARQPGVRHHIERNRENHRPHHHPRDSHEVSQD